MEIDRRAIPAGIWRSPQWPAIGAAETGGLLLPGALGLALVDFAEAIGPARSFAATHRYRIDGCQPRADRTGSGELRRRGLPGLCGGREPVQDPPPTTGRGRAARCPA